MPEQGGIKKYIQLLLDRGTVAKTQRELQDALDRGTDPKVARQNIREIERSANGLNGAFKKLGVMFAGVFAVSTITNFAREMWALGTAAEETGSKFATTFGAGEAQVQQFIDAQGTLLGLNKTMAREMTATAGAIVQGMGMSKEASAAFSVQMVKAAGDLQSFHNVPIADTFTALRAGLTGETEPLKRFGIVLSAADVQMRALSDSTHKNKEALTQEEIAAARLNLILEKMGPALGDVDRTQDSTANRARKLAAEWENVRIELAEKLMPAFASVVEVLTENKQAFSDLGTAMARLIDTVGPHIGKFFQDVAVEAEKLRKELQALKTVWEFFAGKKITGPAADARDLYGPGGIPRAGRLEGVTVTAQGPRRTGTGTGTPTATTANARAQRAAMAAARRDAERAEKDRIRELERAAAYQLRHFATPAMGTAPTQVQGAKDFGLPTPTQRDVSMWEEFFWTVQDGAEQTGDLMADTFSRSFDLLFSNLDDLNQAFGDFFGNIAAGALAAISTEARGRAQMSFADALTAGAKAAGAMASGNVASAGGYATAAAKHLAAGAAWSAIAGGMGAGARGVGGSVGGGRIGGGGYDRNPGGRAAGQIDGQTIVYVAVDPFNPKNPVHSQQVGKAVDLHVELSGRPEWSKQMEQRLQPGGEFHRYGG